MLERTPARSLQAKKHILMVFAAVPYPQRARGEALRYFPIIQHLATRHHVHIIVISNEPVDPEAVKALEQYCQSVSIIESYKYRPLGPLQDFLFKLSSLLPWTTTSLLFPSVGKNQIVSELRAATRGSHHDAVLWVTAPHEAFLGVVEAKRHVVDFIDSPTLHLERQVSGSCRWPIVQAYEEWKMRRWEGRLSRKMDASIYISPVDANAVSRARASAHARYVVPNGVSAENYTVQVDEQMQSPNIGFLGNMAYMPNISAVHWLYEHVFLPARRELSNLTLYVIGRSPDASILALGKQEGVVVTGEVEKVWPYLNGIDVCVFPLWKGTGLKNKVLEAMYAKRSVVASPIAMEGIEGVPGRDFLVCQHEFEFVRETLHLLKSADLRREMGESARRLVANKFSWQQVFSDFERILVGSPKE